MSYQPLAELNEECLKDASSALCKAFQVESLRQMQEEAGQHVLRGEHVFLDAPTGSGKTLAFFYPLFYFWNPGCELETSRKIILVVGPLVGLMEAQAQDLVRRGIPAIALTAETEDLVTRMQEFGANKYRVGFIGPEMANKEVFHKYVLQARPFKQNIICLAIDEGHTISEWSDEDFRPEFANLGKLRARLPSNLPLLVASATMPKDIIADVKIKLSLPFECHHISISNAKLNVAVSVRIIQHPQETFADLLDLFPENPSGPDDFPQTLIYVNSRRECERLQDFLRRNTPAAIPTNCFEFYHRCIDEERKRAIQEQLMSGTLRCVPASDALGLGLDFRKITRVILWGLPRTFLSLVQKFGRCCRDHSMFGEVIIFITASASQQYAIDLEILEAETHDDDVEDSVEHMPDADVEVDENDRDTILQRENGAADSDDNESVDEAHGQDPVPSKVKRAARARQLKKLSLLKSRDRRYLLQFVLTEECRRLVWDRFFGNEGKAILFNIDPPRCCDNCHPELFPITSIRLEGGPPRRPVGRQAKSSEELFQAVVARLESLRDEIVRTDYPNQTILTPKIILPDDVIDTLATRARLITSVDMLTQRVHWCWASRYGQGVVDATQSIVALYPDAREARERERGLEAFLRMARKEFQAKLVLVFDGAFSAIEGMTRTVVGPRHEEKSIKLCQPFLQLPKKNQWPFYYEIIEHPISMAHIKKFSHKATNGYSSVTAFYQAWSQMFDNCRTFNESGSLICQDANALQRELIRVLQDLSQQHDIPGIDPEVLLASNLDSLDI